MGSTWYSVRRSTGRIVTGCTVTGCTATGPRRTVCLLGERFVGREAELSSMTAALDRAARGRGAVVSVACEPGVGKTSLLRAFATAAGTIGADERWGTCFEAEAQAPYGPWLVALPELARPAGQQSTGLRAP